MARPATGHVRWRRNAKTNVAHWHARLSLEDGSRPWVPLDPMIPRGDEPRAKECAKLVSHAARELSALEWGDVDLEHGIVHVHRSNDRVRRRGVKSTKSDAARRIPIEPALAPLLKALYIETGGKGPVFRVPSVGILSRKLKGYLKRAGVTRADLFESDATRKAITFHDLRATGITWCAVRGDEPLKIMQRAGHADLQTTQIYVREAENLAAAFGAVFPALPGDLLAGRGSASVSDSATDEASNIAISEDFGVEPTRIELSIERLG